MGTTRAGSRRSVIAVALVSAFVMLAPVVVFAQEKPRQEQKCSENPKQPKCNSLCWQKEQCQKESGKENARGSWEQNKESDATCGGSPWGYCYPPNIETKLQIPIGEAKDVADVGKYIKTVYLFLLGIGGLVGAIILIHAGFLWIVSGGNTATIERAKKHIQDAAIGLLLLFGSYTILSAINPDLVKLKVPKAQLLRNIALEFEPVKPGMEGGPCDVANAMSVNACKAACAGCDCYSFKESGAETLAQYTMWAVASVVSGGAVLSGAGAGSIAAGARAVLPKLLSASKSTFGVLKKLVGFGFSHPQAGFLSAVIGFNTAKDFENWLDQQGIAMDEPGICINAPKNILKRGELCGLDESCIQPMKCVTFIESFGGLEKGVGTCSDGTEGSACRTGEDCNNGLRCVDGPLELKECAPLTGRAAGTACGLGHNEPADTICAAGHVCKITNMEFAFTFDEVGYGYCISVADLAIDAARGGGVEGLLPRFIGDGCGKCPGEADGGLDAQELGYGLQCASIPQQGSLCTRVCESHGDCALGCPPGKECACREGRCVLGSQVQEVRILRNGGTGCDDPSRFQCSDGLICTADPVPPLGNRYVCTDKALGSWCSIADECGAGSLCDEDPNNGTFKCIRE